MRLLILCAETIPEEMGGGAEISTYYLAEAISRFSKEVDEVYLAVGDISQNLAQRIRRCGVNLLINPALIPRFAYYTGIFPARAFYRTFCEELLFINSIRYLLDILSKYGIDAIYAHHIYSALPAVASSKILEKPSCVAIRDFWPICLAGTMLRRSQEICDRCRFSEIALCLSEGHGRLLGFRSAFYNIYARYRLWFRKKILERASILLANSKFLMERLANYFPNNCINFLYNPVDVKRFKPMDSREAFKELKVSRLESEDRFVITYVGPAKRYKGFHVLVKAIPRIMKEVPNVLFLFAGSIPKQVTEYLSRKFKDSVLVMGYVSRLKIPYLYAISDLVVFPSIWPECFGRVVAEAMACSKPVVASSVGAIPEYISHERSGWLIPPNNPNELAESVIVLEDDRKKLKIIGENARKVAEKLFSLEVIAKNFDEIIKNSCKKKY